MMVRRRAIRAFAAVATTASCLGAIASGCSADNAIVGGSCANGYTECDLHCVNLENDPANCGACGHACPPGVACSGGACGSSPVDAAGDGPVDAADAASYADAPYDGSPVDAPIVDSPSDVTPVDATDACTPPYDTAAQCGDCFTVCSGVNDTCVLGDGGYACAPLCSSPLTECSGTCVDLTNDPDNCGSCGNVCQSQICQNSQCVGSTAGGVVFIGHDYLKAVTSVRTSQAQVLDNAVFIPARDPLPVLAYQRYADAKAVTKVGTILNAYATATSRTLAISATNTDTDIPNKLTIQSFAVLLVYDQESAPSGALGPLGTSWQSTLATFTQAGGIVVVLDGAAGNTQEMPLLVTNAGLLNVTAQTSVAPGTQLADIAPGDAVGVGVVSPYGAAANTVSVAADPPSSSIIYVIFDNGTNEPVVVHKVIP